MPEMTLSEEDAHSRVAILFEMPPRLGEEESCLLAVSVKWIIENGTPRDPKTGEIYKYGGTYIIQ